MTVLEEFYAGYLHYTVAFRLWTDTCRQLSECRGTLEERQALVDETLRLSMCVADNIDDVESLIADTLEYLQSSESPDSDLLEAISLITNNLREDRARADDYTKFVMRRRSGGKEKRPRRPQVANPFEFIPVDDEEEETEASEDAPDVPDPGDGTPGTEPEGEVPEEQEETVQNEQEPDTDNPDTSNPLARESERMAQEQSDKKG